MQLRFDEKEINNWSKKYQPSKREIELEIKLIQFKDSILKEGYLTKEKLEHISLWKSPRSFSHILKNDESFIKEITSFSLRTKNERARIEVLTVLDGVLWPTASVILHWFHSDKYPILDFRALWSVNEVVPIQYTFDFWWDYVEFCRHIADKNQIDMRTLDKALWQFSNENQKIKKK